MNEEYVAVLKHCPLFNGLSFDEIKEACEALFVIEKSFRKNEILHSPGEMLTVFGIVVYGTVAVNKADHKGNVVTVTYIKLGDFFGEAFAFSDEPFAMEVMAVENTGILYFNTSKLFSSLNSAKWGAKFIENVLRIFSKKNIFLTRRIEHLTRHTLREKILSYLTELEREQGTKHITVPFDRQGMADYLATDRSALSAVLSVLKKEGKIDYWKNQFSLKR